MSFNYHITGIISGLFVVLSLLGIYSQLKLIWERKALKLQGNLKEGITEVLSLNRFFTSFIGFYAMYLYGLSLVDFNYYIVIPRIVALVILFIILYEIHLDRKNSLTKVMTFLSLILILISILILFSSYRVDVYYSGFSSILLIFVMLLLLQGGFHQMMKIRKSGKTGSLSLKMHQFYMLKDISSMTFGVAMGIKIGWPVIIYHAFSLILQLVTMYHFRWVKLSDLAKSRRSL